MEANLNKQDKAIAQKIDTLGGDDNLIVLSTGVVLRAKQANPNVLIRIMTATPRPQPPVYFNEAMGREMENPDHPDYVKRVSAWEMEYNNGMLNALVGLGTELVSAPKKFPKPDDDSWVEDYKALGLPVNLKSPAWRYITWVLFKAAVIDTDTKLIGDSVKLLSGVKEADVRDAETFPDGYETGGGDSGNGHKD